MDATRMSEIKQDESFDIDWERGTLGTDGYLRKFYGITSASELEDAILYLGTKDNLLAKYFRTNEDGVEERLYDKLYGYPDEQHEFVVGYTGVYALPLHEGSSSETRVTRACTHDHRKVYLFFIADGLAKYIALIQKNQAANKSYQIPEFTLEKATEIADEAFKLSFERTRESYTIKRDGD